MPLRRCHVGILGERCRDDVHQRAELLFDILGPTAHCQLRRLGRRVQVPADRLFDGRDLWACGSAVIMPASHTAVVGVVTFESGSAADHGQQPSEVPWQLVRRVVAYARRRRWGGGAAGRQNQKQKEHAHLLLTSTV